MRATTVLVLVLLTAGSVLASPSIHRDGANHHLGDDSFVARFGRPPDARDSEPLRMRVHLAHVRALLGARPATRPELAARRAELLSYLDDYIAKGTTPINTYVHHRSPVFIDRQGTICAVGYLIERSVGRALPERIAAEHRLDFLEDIAAAMPEVRAWVDGSGLTLDELASIQPAYAEPHVMDWHTWDLVKYPQPDGPYDKFGTGTMRKQKMEGAWTVTGEDGTVLGQGEMHRGAGAWTSLYPDGKLRAQGPYVANRAHGAWKLFHPSGNLAAEGRFDRGDRDGRWRFYYDTPDRTPIAIGRFGGGHVVGVWRHFDAEGRLVARTSIETPDAPMWIDDDWTTDGGEGFHLDIVARPGEARHRFHQGMVGREHQQLESLALAGERIYIHTLPGYDHDVEVIYDAGGSKLERDDDGVWHASSCHWSEKRKRIARAGDIAFLHGLLYREARAHGLVKPSFLAVDVPNGDVPETAIACRAPRSVAAARGEQLDQLMAGRDADHASTPSFVRTQALGSDFLASIAGASDDDLSDSDLARKHGAEDLTRILAANMREWIEWPHIDNPFDELFATMPGRFTKNWVEAIRRSSSRPTEMPTTDLVQQLRVQSERQRRASGQRDLARILGVRPQVHGRRLVRPIFGHTLADHRTLPALTRYRRRTASTARSEFHR